MSYFPTVYRIVIPRLRVRERVSLHLAFGRAVRRLRQRRGYSEEQISTRAGVPPIQIRALERGELTLSLAIAERLAVALGIAVSTLLREAERERSP